MNLIYDIWTEKEYSAFLNDLKPFSNREFSQFQNTLMPGTRKILGIKMPILRKIANEILKGNWRSFIGLCSNTYYEETTLKGMIIGMSNVSLLEYTHMIETFSLGFRNWLTCDTFCTTLKGISNYPQEFWIYLDTLLSSKRPWQVRMGVVIILNHYLNDDYINQIFLKISTVRLDSYYVKMAVAWLLSSAYTNYPGVTYGYLTNCTLETWTYNKTLEKILEQKDVPNEQKLMILTLKNAKKRPQLK
ncbi:DNA alkylation repair protein [Candidatus Galacturonibacter soehngenii]|uniref:DNA alkylation repair protein n=1 Tax=Candidatus Galacturonatibacter soehngenii TaxID=2307010 RepID=A0A7V7UHL7_9FIRM|nr:DNA alkylation repair protein [Candidatus Galacturonibacter soehngenii]KAB1440098.1 DNA alkylation repair protein [Candidatus Galacturonibacter soehngenii]